MPTTQARIEARLSQSPAPLTALTDLGDALGALAIAASWPAFCLDERPDTWAFRQDLAHALSHALRNSIYGGRPRRDRRDQYGYRGDALRIALLIDAFRSDRRGFNLTEDLRRDFEAQLRDESSRSEPPGPHLLDQLDDRDGSALEHNYLGRGFHRARWQPFAPTDVFFARYFRAEVAATRPEYLGKLEILDLRLASPPVLRLGFSTTILAGGGFAAFELNPVCGAVVMLLGLIDATLVCRTNLAKVRGLEAETNVTQANARAAIARETLREHIYVIAQGRLEESPEIVELVTDTALPAVLRLSEPSVDDLRPLPPEADESLG